MEPGECDQEWGSKVKCPQTKHFKEFQCTKEIVSDHHLWREPHVWEKANRKLFELIKGTIGPNLLSLRQRNLDR